MNISRTNSGGLWSHGDGAAGGDVLRAGPPTDQQLRVINGRLSVTPLDAERVFVVPAEMSNTLLDSYLTWMHDTALETYAANVRAGRGIPMMTHHLTYGAFGVGRWFEAVIEDMPASSAARRPAGTVPLARDVFGRKEGPEKRLVEIGRIVRGLAHGAVPNDAIIDAIEAGDIDSVSIGATLNPIKAPRANLFCDICDTSMLWRRGDACTHYPGVVYEVDKIGPVMATARYVYTAQREGSLVSIPANDTALIQRAADLAAGGHMSDDDARRLEEVYGANILPARHYSIPTAAGAGDITRTADGSEPMGDDPDATTDPADMTADHGERSDPMPNETAPVAAPAPSAIDDVRRLLGNDLTAGLEAYRADGRGEWEMATRMLHALFARSEQRLGDLTRTVAAGLGQAEGEDLATVLARVDREREAGRQAREKLLGDLVRAHVAAHNLAEAGFDREKFLRRASAWTLEDIADEIDTLGKLRRAQLTPGTTVPRTVDDPDRAPDGDGAADPKPARPAYNPAFSRA
ncbi:MAG: hypothetical protein DYG90_00650 [Chloroflexi bacterium CFX6]|nr:hypothetical protein [Chloroflexi bacterium CFX6]